MAGMRVSKNMVRRLALQVLEDYDGEEIGAEAFTDELGLTDSAAAKLLSELADAGDIDRRYPPNEPGKRGRSKAVFVKMTDDRAAELADTIKAREQIAVRVKKFDSANVTLRRVSMSLIDFCNFLGIPAPEDVFANEPDDDADELSVSVADVK